MTHVPSSFSAPESSPVPDAEVPKNILKYINVPYFKNNPWYLELWEREYLRTKDPVLLFLMLLKDVGTLHSWLYLQLHAYYKDKCSICSSTIIRLALRNNTYPKDRVEAIRLPTSQAEVEVEAHPLEKPTKIFLFGREWIESYTLSYNRSLLMVDGVEVSIMEYRVFDYLRRMKEREKALDEVAMAFGEPHPLPPSISPLPPLTLKPLDNVVIEDILCVVKKQLGEKTYVITRIANVGEEKVTLNAQDFILKVSPPLSSSLLSSINHPLVLPIERTSTLKEREVVLSKYEPLGSLKAAIATLTLKIERVPETLSFFYILQILKIIEVLENNQLELTDCTEEDFVLSLHNGQIVLKLCSFKEVARIRRGGEDKEEKKKREKVRERYRIFDRLIEHTRIERTRDLLGHRDLPLWRQKIEQFLLRSDSQQNLIDDFETLEVLIYESNL